MTVAITASNPARRSLQHIDGSVLTCRQSMPRAKTAPIFLKTALPKWSNGSRPTACASHDTFRKCFDEYRGYHRINGLRRPAFGNPRTTQLLTLRNPRARQRMTKPEKLFSPAGRMRRIKLLSPQIRSRTFAL
jgi:hypothetical protein